MHLEDEVVGIRRRRAELERALLHLDDTLAITLIKAVIEDMMRELPHWKRQRSLRSTAPSSPPEFKLTPSVSLPAPISTPRSMV
jgi:hypothetical protein